MARKDRIEGFIRELYSRGKKCYSKQEILAEVEKQIKPSEGYKAFFEEIPDHEYDQQALTDALASVLVRRS